MVPSPLAVCWVRSMGGWSVVAANISGLPQSMQTQSQIVLPAMGLGGLSLPFPVILPFPSPCTVSPAQSGHCITKQRTTHNAWLM